MIIDRPCPQCSEAGYVGEFGASDIGGDEMQFSVDIRCQHCGWTSEYAVTMSQS